MTDPLTFNSELKENGDKVASMLAHEPQQSLYALLTHRLDTYHEEIDKNLVRVVMFSVIMGLLGTLLMLAVLSGVYGVSSWLFPTQVHHVLMYILSVVIIGFGFIIKLVTEEGEVSISQENGKIQTWSWGRLDDIIDSNSNSAIFFFLGIIFAGQISLILFHETHLGFGEALSFWQATILSLDNLLHGVCLDVMEMYHISLSSLESERSVLTTSLFLVFRLGYDALFLMWLFMLYQRHQARGLFKGYPKGEDERVEALLAWMQSSCASSQGWVRRFTDELIFLMMCEEYLRGHYEVVHHLGNQFPRLRVTDEMRTLFIHPETGSALLQPHPQDEE